MEDFLQVPKDFKGYVIGAKGSTINTIEERSEARVYSLSRDEEGFWVSGTREQRELAKKLILEKVEEGKLKFEKNQSLTNKTCYFIDDFNLPVNTMLRLEKGFGPPMEYRLRPFHSCGPEESPSLSNDPIYFKTLEAEVLHSLERIKHKIETKRHLKADIWCHFGTVLIRQPDEGPGGEWSIENALRKLLEGTEWKTLFRGGVNLDEKFVEQHLRHQSLPEYEDFQSRYDITFRTPNRGQLTFKVWVTKKNLEKTLDNIVIPFSDLKNILDEVCFEDQFTSSRCRGWLMLPPQRYLRADILFPGCKFDCRLTIHALADSGFHMDFVPKDDIRNTLQRYLSKVTFSDEDDVGLRLPDEKLPDGFQVPFMRCSKRAAYRFSEDFSIILSKESTGVYGRDIKKGTAFHLHCKKWDELLNSENWEPDEITKKLPDFFRFVKKVQSSIIHEGATVTYCMEHKEEIANFVDVPHDLKCHVIGKQGNTLRSIKERSGAKAYSHSKAQEGFWVEGTKEQRELAKNLILEMVERGKVKREEKNASRVRCYIDDFNMPANTNLKLEKEDGAQAGYRLRSIYSYEEESLSPRNDPIYFKDLEKEVLHALERIKRDIKTKHHLKADIRYHFGTVLILEPDEGTGGEWSIEDAIHKLLEGTKWNTVFKEVINFDEKFVEQHLDNQLHPEYDNYLSRYDLVFKVPNGGELSFKAWVKKKNVGEKLEKIPIPHPEVKNILDEVDFHDPFTSSRCHGWLTLRPLKYLRANILFPGCKFDCRLNIRVLADNARYMDLVPKEDTRNALLSYLSKVTFSDEDDFGLRLPDKKKLPDGFELSFMRCSKRAKYRFSEDFSIILSKESTRSGSDVKKVTDLHLHCKEWDELFHRGNWEPAEITKKLPDFFSFVKKVQSSIIHEIEHEGASVPPEILARGSSAVASYFKALADGRTSIKRVPIMLIGQDRAGKTSLKKSLKGICFDPEEDSTVGIDVDPSYFKVTTDTFRTGTAAEQQDAEGDISFDRHAAMKIVHDLRKGNENPLPKTITEETKTPVEGECEITDIIQLERHLQQSETREQAPTPTNDAPDISPFPSGDSQEARTDLTRTYPDEIAKETETLLKGDLDDNRDHVFLTLWDFAGQSVYYDTHPIFITKQAIFFLVYDLSLNPHEMAKPVVKQGVYEPFQDSVNLKTNLDYLDFWMRSVASLAGGAPESPGRTAAEEEMLPQKLPPVFLVCTHADAPYDKKRNAARIAHEILGCLKRKPYGIHLSDVFVVDNTKSGTESECPEVVSLRKEVYDVAKGLPHISETIPIKWLKFDKALRALKEQGNHFVSLEMAKDIAKSCDVVDHEEFETAMDYLHDLRILIHFDDTQALNELVVLDVQWLIDVFKNVITVRPYDRKEKKFVDLWSKLEEEGILHEELLSHVWRNLREEQGLHEGLMTIMEKFSLLCPLSSETPKTYLVPSMLKTRPSSEIVGLVSSAQIPSLFIKFKPEKVPAGLFHRLVLQFFQWGKEIFLSANKPQLFQNVVRFVTCGDKICSVIFVCYTSTVEIAIYAEDQQKTTAYTCASAVCRQLGLILESMRKEFFWLRHMRYEMAVLCPVCCLGGSLMYYCPSRDLEGFQEEHCLHFWSLSELCSAKKPIVCSTPRLKKDVIVDVEQFSPWLSPSEQQNANGEPPARSLSTDEGNEDKALALPDKLQESLASLSCDPRQIVSLFKENQSLMEASLEQPDYQTMKWLRCLSREANIAKRLDVVKHLRSISRAGTVGPLLSENLDVREIPIRQGRQLTIALSGGDEWKFVAEKLGLNPREIRYLDKRVLNPAESLLVHVAEKRGLTVGELYDVLSDCGLPLLADEL